MKYKYIEYTGNNYIFINFDKYEIVKRKKAQYVNCGSGFDTETSRISTDSDVSIVYIWQFSIGEYIYYCRDINLFVKFISDLNDNLEFFKLKIYTWVANISYDMSYMFNLINTLITSAFYKNKHHCIYVECSNIIFHECIGIFGYSLKNIAENYTISQKLVGDIDHTQIRNSKTVLTNDELQYCFNDVQILSELTETAFNLYIRNDKMPLTQTGIVRNKIKNAIGYIPLRYMKTDTISRYYHDEKMYFLHRKYLYSGGLTHSNFKYVGNILSNVKCVDITSAYPYALNAYFFPSGKFINVSNEKYINDIMKHNKQYDIYDKRYISYIAYIRINNIHSKSTHSIISIKKCLNTVNVQNDNGRVLNATCIELYVNEIDMLNINNIYDYDSINIITFGYFEKKVRCLPKILDVMNNAYTEKNIMKKSGKHKTNQAEYMRLKQLVNAIYGMIVTGIYEKSYEFNDELCTIDEKSIDFENAVQSQFLNPYIGYWVTAYTRKRLVDVISKFPDIVVQYDTDSIYYINNPDIENYITEINNELSQNNSYIFNDENMYDMGLWENDGEYNRFMPLGSKRYAKEKIIDNKIKHDITYAGANTKALLDYISNNNIDFFEYMQNIDLDCANSGKKTIKYGDEYGEYIVTDYQGNTSKQQCFGYATIVDVPFNAHIAASILHLKKLYTYD